MMGKASRGRPKRTWVKLDCYGILHGSINWQLTLEEQAVWIKTFAYSAVCGGNPGILQDNDSRPLPHWYIAAELHCPLEVFESMLSKCIKENRLKENEHGIEVVNFDAYQFTEYDRQKPYRERKKEHEATLEAEGKCTICGEAGHNKYVCPKSKYGHIVKQ